MPRETETLRFLRNPLSSYRPSSEEVERLAEVVRLSKLYLAYLRRVKDVLKNLFARRLDTGGL